MAEEKSSNSTNSNLSPTKDEVDLEKAKEIYMLMLLMQLEKEGYVKRVNPRDITNPSKPSNVNNKDK